MLGKELKESPESKSSKTHVKELSDGCGGERQGSGRNKLFILYFNSRMSTLLLRSESSPMQNGSE